MVSCIDPDYKAPAQRGVLVLLPPGGRYYPYREAFGLISNFVCFYAAPDPLVQQAFRSRPQFVDPDYRVIAELTRAPSARVAFAKRLGPLIRELRPDVVVTFEVYSSLSFQTSLIRRSHSFAQCVLVHETSSSKSGLWGRVPHTRFFSEVVRRTADLVIAHNSLARAALVESGFHSSQIELVYPGIFLEDFPEKLRSDNTEDLRVTYVGELRDRKGVPALVEAVRRVRSKWQLPVTLTLAGKGPLSDELRETSSREPWLRMMGYISELEKRRLLQNSDLFVYPSVSTSVLGFVRWQEQGALSAVEAMAAGLPVLGSNSGAIPEILGRDDVIFEQGDPQAICKRIKEVLVDSDRRRELSRYNRERARAVFGMDDCVRKLRDAILKRL